MAINISTNPVTSSGTISANTQLRSKLKETSSGSVRLGELYRNGTYVPDAPANTSIPTSGAISFSDFYGANVGSTATITGVEENLNAAGIFGIADYGSALRKTIVINGYVISQNSNPALTIPTAAGSTITLVLTAGGIFGHRGTSNGSSTSNGIGGSGGGGSSRGNDGPPGRLALSIRSTTVIQGTGASIAGGGGAGGGGGGGGREGDGGKNKRGYSCGFLGWQYCESCDNNVGGGGDGGGRGGDGGVGKGYRYTSGNLILVNNTNGSGGSNPGNGGGRGGNGGNGGGWGSSGTGGQGGDSGSTGPGGNCQGGSGGSGGGGGSNGGGAGGSIAGYNYVTSISSTSVLSGPTSIQS